MIFVCHLKDHIRRKYFFQFSETTKNITCLINWNNFYTYDDYNIENIHSLSRQKVQVRDNFKPYHNDCPSIFLFCQMHTLIR